MIDQRQPSLNLSSLVRHAEGAGPSSSKRGGGLPKGGKEAVSEKALRERTERLQRLKASKEEKRLAKAAQLVR